MSIFESNYLTPPSKMGLRNGVDWAVEEEADRLLAKGREGVTALCDKRDYLTQDQLKLRAQKEVMPTTGFSDESVMSGLFRRAYNPLSGKRPTGHGCPAEQY